MELPRIVLAEDNPKMREKVRSLLRLDFDIVGSVADGQQAVDSTLNQNPDILVTDISMPFLMGSK